MVEPALHLLSWFQSAALFACPLVAYILLFKGKHKHRNKKSHYSIPYWNFFLKRWWVRWRLWRLHYPYQHRRDSPETAFMPTQEDADLEAQRMLIEDKEVDSLMIRGTDNKGNALHLKICRKQHNTMEVWLYAQMGNGSVFLLPEHPDCTFINSHKSTWSGGGLKLQMCEPLRKWRISFNGLLRHQQRKFGNEDEDKDIKHVRFSFIWSACSDIVDIQKDWNTNLKCDAIAREPWRSTTWMEMRKQIGEGYDQWGILHGTWQTFDDVAEVKELYLRGIRQRRYGIDESEWLRRCVNYVGVTADGTMFSVEARSSEKPGLTHALFGHVYCPDGCQKSMDSCDFELPNIGEYPDSIPQHVVLRFTAGGKNYTSTIHTVPHSGAYLHGGRPWNYEALILAFRCSLNTDRAINLGAGTALFWYRYTGTCPPFTPASVNTLKEPQFKFEAPIPLVLDFKERLCGSSALVGGKGSSLGLMASVKNDKLQAVIPPGFCLTVEALEVQMHEYSQLQQSVTTLSLVSSSSSELNDIQEQCYRTVSLFSSTPVCETVSSEVAKHLKRILSENAPGHFAVRSSAVGEDSEGLSAAGQNATFLGVHGELVDILEAIQKCWASLYTFQSLQYRRQHGQPLQVGMGVVVQQMVASDTAGVLFTCHPTNGDPRHMLITANYGLGESVVSAQVDPDTIILSRDRMGQIAVKESKCGRKAHRVSISDDGGITAQLMEQDKVSELCITTTEALALGKLGLQLEQMFGSPRDVEWAISKGQMYLLQARPITTLDSWSDFELLHEFDSPIISDTEVLTTANVGEVFPGVITPLTQSITLRSADLGTRQGLPYRPGYHYPSSIVTSSHHGMINILNTMLRSVGKKITIADKVVDLAVYGHLVTSPEFLRLAIERNGYLNSWGKLFIVLKILKDMILKGRVVRQAKKLSDEFILDYSSHNNAKSLYNSISKGLSTLAKVADCHTYTSRVGLFTQVVAITVLTEGSEELSAEHFSDMGLLLSSCSDVVSAQIPVILEDLAASIVATGRGAIFCKVSPSQAVKWLSENCPIISIKLTGFLNRHGHRCIKEFELMTETWSMNPEGLMKTLQSMVRNLAGAKSKKATKKNITDQELLSQLKSVKKAGTRKVLSWLLAMCRSSVADREANKDCYITVTQRLRLAYRHLAHLMVKEGRIPDAQLLYFFSHYELGILLRTRDAVIITKAQRRRRLLPQWEQLLFPEIIRGLPMPIPVETSKGSKTTGLKGTSVYPGTVMGRACVVLNLDQISKLKQGDILITHSTDVGWSPYFPLLGGVVTELGGLISHGAVVAREYGLPCIIGCQGATTAFSTEHNQTGVVEKLLPVSRSSMSGVMIYTVGTIQLWGIGGDTVLLVAGLGTLQKISEGMELTTAS